MGASGGVRSGRRRANSGEIVMVGANGVLIDQGTQAVRVGTADVSVITNNAERLRVLNNGNVGIGVSNPSTALQVSGVSSFGGNVGIGLTNPDTALQVAGVSSFGGNVGIGLTNPSTVLAVNGTSSFTGASAFSGGSIFTGGNVGIGLTNPLCSLYNYKSGTTGWAAQSYFGNQNTGVILGCLNNVATIGGHSAALDGWANICVPLGNVGIGTTDPKAKLDVWGTIYSKGLYQQLGAFMKPYNIPGINGGAVLGVLSGAAGNEQPCIYMAENGSYVGIGTSNPHNRLMVTSLGTAYTAPVLVIDSGNAGNTTAGAPRGVGQPLIGVGSLSYTGGAASGDYYGIGFGYTGGLASNYYAAEIGCMITNSTGNEIGDLVFSTRPTTSNVVATERMRIRSDGNVGIGITNPTEKLLVIGNIVAKGPPESMYAGFIFPPAGTYSTGSPVSICRLQWYADTWDMRLHRSDGPGAERFSMARGTREDFSIDGSGNMWIRGGLTQYSDIRLKKNIGLLPQGLDIISRLNPVTYHFNEQDDNEQVHFGLIAQETQEIIPNVIQTSQHDDKLTINYIEIIPILIKALKDQIQINQDLNARLSRLESLSSR